MKRHAKKWLIFFMFAMMAVSGCAMTSPLTMTRDEEELLGEIMDMLDTTMAEAQEKMDQRPDPTSPLNVFTKKLAEKQAYMRQINAGEIPYDPDIISKFTDEIKEIQLHIQNPVERLLEADVSFALGKYKISDLSEQGKEVLRGFAREIVDVLVKKQKELFPNNTFLVIVQTVGYADEIAPGPELRKNLMQGMEASLLREEHLEERQFLNQALSHHRSQSINAYIRTELESRLQDDPQVKIGEPEVTGLGEKFPYSEETVFPPYQSEDKRRRICKVHGKVFRQ